MKNDKITSTNLDLTIDQELLAKTVKDIYKLKPELWNSLFITESLSNINNQLPEVIWTVLRS